MASRSKVRFNRKLAGVLLLLAIVGGVGVAAAHRVQKRIGVENARQVGLAAVEQQDWERAAGHLKFYLNAEPNDVEALTACATALLDGYGSYAEAYELQERVLKLQPANHRARQRQIEVALRLGWNEPATTHAAALLKSQPEDAEAQYLAGRCEESAGRVEAAITLYAQAAETDPQHIAANQRLALLYAASPDTAARADAAMARLEATGDRSLETLTTLARIRAHRRQFDDAYELICQAAVAGPLDHECLLLATQLATRQANEARATGRAQLATEIVQKWQSPVEAAITGQPETTLFDIALVMLQRAAGQHDAAMLSLQRVIERVPGQRELQFQYAWQLLELQRLDAAEQAIAALPESDIGDAWRRVLSGLLLVQRQEWQAARDALQQCLTDGVEPAVAEPEVRLQYVSCCVRLDDWPAASAACEDMLRRFPGHRLAQTTLALSRLAQGDYPQGVRDLRQIPALKLLLVRPEDAATAQQLSTPLRFEIPTDAALQAATAAEHHRAQVFLSALIEVCRGRLDTAQQRLAAAGDNRPDERLFDLVSLSSNGRIVSIDDLHHVVQADPDDARAISALFAAWASQGSSAEIDAFVRDRLSRLNSDTWVQRALVLGTACSNSSRMLTDGHPKLGESLSQYAETLFRKTVELDRAATWQLISFLAAHGQTDEARQLCRTAWDSNPGTIARLWMTQAQSLSNPAPELKDLQQHCRKTLSAQPEPDVEVSLRLVLGGLALMSLSYAQAEAEYARVVALDPASTAAANNLAWLLAMQGQDLDRALQLATQALTVDGRSANLLDTRACVYLARQEAELALQDLNEAARVARSADIEFHRAVALHRLGQRTSAAESLRRAQKLGFDLQQRPPLEHPLCLEVLDLWSELVAVRLP